MSRALETIAKIEALGGSLALDGQAIRYRVPRGRPEVQGLLDELKGHRDEVIRLLRLRLAAPAACFHCGGSGS